MVRSSHTKGDSRVKDDPANHAGDLVRFPAIWMTQTAPLAYRVLPKCGCSSVMQVLHYIDHGRLYDGMTQDRREAPILKTIGGKRETWGDNPANAEVRARFAREEIFCFTLTRNPYRRLLSSFADKVFGYQSNGRRYNGGKFHRLMAKYGLSWGPNSQIADNFKAFLRFAADTIEAHQPIPADLHWAPFSAQLRFNFRCSPRWRLDFIGQLEHFQRDLDTAMQQAGIGPERLPAKIPRENSTTLPDLPIRSFFGPEEIAIMRRVYAEDFELFGYGPDPERTRPVEGIDIAAVNRHLRAAATRRRGVRAGARTILG
jgi:hypothetical protein